MKKTHQLAEGTKLKYTGKGFENFDKDNPYMTFLGYDSHGWTDLWVDYNGKKMCVSINEVEVAGGSRF
jgi:hypothetical protein